MTDIASPNPAIAALGASQQAIEHHYDTGNAFFATWLDPSMTYTSAFFDGGEDDLHTAQLRKIDYFAHHCGIAAGAKVLDIGCGWGGALERFVLTHGAAKGIGLTLSPSQQAYVRTERGARVAADLCAWQNYATEERFDAIVSVESIEAFVKPNLTRQQKVQVYRAFFGRCHAWLKPSGRIGLQMIAYGKARPGSLDAFIANEIFPESDLPTLSEVIEAAEGLFEVVSLRNDRRHYALTLRKWLSNIKHNRERATKCSNTPTIKRFEDYLRMSWFMFDSGACDLHRVVFHRIDIS